MTAIVVCKGYAELLHLVLYMHGRQQRQVFRFCLSACLRLYSHLLQVGFLVPLTVSKPQRLICPLSPDCLKKAQMLSLIPHFKLGCSAFWKYCYRISSKTTERAQVTYLQGRLFIFKCQMHSGFNYLHILRGKISKQQLVGCKIQENPTVLVCFHC